MKKFNLKRLTSLGVAMSLVATMTACSRGSGNKILQKESDNFISDSVVSVGDVDCTLEDNNDIYDSTGMFSSPLSKYDFTYFPEVYCTDVDLATVLDAYGVSYEDYVNKFVRVIYASGGADNYEEAYALTTLVLNRFIDSRYNRFGDNIVDIITVPNQFGYYANGEYLHYDVEELENYVGWQAIIDCLINFAEDQTNRMHNSLSYRDYSIDGYSDCIYTSVGNRYGDTDINTLQEENIIYQDLYLEQLSR
ncbi:MAG: hypothetical protein NC483_04275 [Ruminococcus sp.]|nr:hypothetical protein [Ruminococcus sp.]